MILYMLDRKISSSSSETWLEFPGDWSSRPLKWVWFPSYRYTITAVYNNLGIHLIKIFRNLRNYFISLATKTKFNVYSLNLKIAFQCTLQSITQEAFVSPNFVVMFIEPKCL